MSQPDVLIIGAGLAGASAAWHLSRDRSVVVVEQGRAPGGEATADNAGMVRCLGEDPVERALALRTHRWLAQPGPGFDATNLSRVTGAVLSLAVDPHHLHDAVAHVRAAGVNVFALRDPGDVAPAMAGGRYATSWYQPDARVADPAALLAAFLAGARAAGAELRCGVQVLGLRVEGGRVVGVDTSEGPLRAGRVLLAAGAWSGVLAESVGVYRPLFPLRRSLQFTAPHAVSAPNHPWCWVDDEGIYFRPESGGWLTSPCDEALDLPLPGPGSRGPVTELQRALVLDKQPRLFPALNGVQLVGGWTGLRTFAPDRRPMLGADPDVPGLWWAAGLGGFGVTCCYGVGEALAAWMRHEDTPWMVRGQASPGRRHMGAWMIRPHGDVHAPKMLRVARR